MLGFLIKIIRRGLLVTKWEPYYSTSEMARMNSSTIFRFLQRGSFIQLQPNEEVPYCNVDIILGLFHELILNSTRNLEASRHILSVFSEWQISTQNGGHRCKMRMKWWSVRLWIIKIFSCCDLSQLIENERKYLEMHFNVLLGDSDDHKEDFYGFEPDDVWTPRVFVVDDPKWLFSFWEAWTDRSVRWLQKSFGILRNCWFRRNVWNYHSCNVINK